MKTKSTVLKLIGSFMVALLFWWANNATAQLNTYTFNSAVGTYTEITGGTLIGSAMPGVGVDWLDDNTYASLPIPFTFRFNGVDYTSFNLNTNGFITFGSITTNSYSPISATTAYEGVIAAIANDLDGRFTTQGSFTLGSNVITGVLHFGGVSVGKAITATGIPAGTTITAFNVGAQTITISQATTAAGTLATLVVYSGELRTETLGTAPNRIHVIQYKNFKRYGAGSITYNGELINFQIRMHETTNNVQIVYGNSIVTATTARTAQVGMRGAVNTDYNNRMTVAPHDWAATTAGTLNSSTCSFLNTGFPANGLTFTFNAPIPPLTVPVLETFEAASFPPYGWTVYNVDGAGQTWVSTTSYNHTGGGTRSAFHTFGPGGLMENGWLVSRGISLPANAIVELKFWSYNTFPTWYYKNSVHVSTVSNNPAGGTFTEIWTPASVSQAWVQTTLNLSAYAGNVVYIAFRYEGDDAHGWAVDDIEVNAIFTGNIAGVVRDAATNDPVIGAHVSIGSETIVTLADGAYAFNDLTAGPKTITVQKVGYINLSQVVDVIAGQTVNQDLLLYETANQPGAVMAELNANSTAVNVTWGLPQGLYEIIYDDGTAENVTAWGLGGNLNALRFTPAGYPAKIMAGSVNIYDGTYPPNGNALVPFQMAVYDASGPLGYPGNELGVVDVTPTDHGWVNFDLSALNITINSGDFYLVMIQGGNFPNCAPIAVNQTNPVMRSYSRFVTGGAPWTPAGFNDFMMRAVVQGPGGPSFLGYGTGELVESSRISEGALFLQAPQRAIAEVGMGIFKPIEGTGEIDRNVVGYRVYRLVEGEEGNEAVWTMLGNPTNTAIVDNSWPSLADGAYRWAVKARYPGDVFSAPTFSNVLRKNWASNVTINVTLSDPNVSAAGIQVGLTNTQFPQYEYNGTTNAQGVVNFPEVWKGNYNIVVYKFGYNPYTAILDIMTNTFTHNVNLLETTYPPSALYVDPLNIHATWVAPGVSLDLLQETWSAGNFSANEWTFDPAQGNWQMDATFGNPAPSARFYWSPSVTNYNNALVSKQLSGLGMPNVKLKYDIYLSNFSTSTLEQMAVEVWNGSSWIQIANYTNAGNIPWTTYTHDITQHAQGQQFKVRFRAYGANSFNINWWNLDNIMVYGEVADGGNRGVIGYFVYLDDIMAGFTEETHFQYQPEYVNYGQTYTAGVRAVYESGFSPIVTYVFTSMFLYPPCNLQGEDAGHAVALTWESPGLCDPFGGSGGGGGGGGGAWTQDFEGGSLPAGWAVQQTNTATSGPTPGYWTVNNYTSATFSPFGTYHVGVWWDYGHQDEWLITPSFSCAANTSLTFWTAVYEGSTYLDHYYVKVSTDNGNTWTAVWDASTLTGNAWNYYSYPYTVNLGAFAGNDIKVAFQAVDGPSNDGLWYVWFLDNIAVTTGTRTIKFDAASLTRISNGSGSVSTQIARDGNTAPVVFARNDFSEYSTSQLGTEIVAERALFDLLGSFPVGDVGGTYSVGTDGNFVYSARWNALLFHKYTMSGTLIESFSIPGAGNVRDLTYDGQFFYGAPNSTTIYKMDFTNLTLAGTITAPVAVRGIAYDATNDGFWITNGWDGPLRLISRTGTTLQTLTTTASSMSGLGWDNVSEGGPYLWAYTQPASNNILVKINLTTGAVLQTFDVATTGVIAPGSISGGLTITNKMINGKWVFLGCAQNDVIWVLELAPDQGGGGGGGPVATDGFRIYRNGTQIAEVDGDTFEYLDEPLIAGTYNYSVTAIYDYNGSMVESQHEGPISVTVAPGLGFVNGVVFDAVTFQPIGGVLVTAGEFNTTTQANGTYTLVAHEGQYNICFDKIGYALHCEPITIVWQQTQTLNVGLTPQPPNFPFEETWASGSFATQGWTFVPSQGNWRMSTTAGNPAPSAEFNWSPSVTNYSNALTSVEIDARAALQNVTLTYSIFLDNYSATAAEKMTVEIWNGTEWVFVAEHKNDNSIPWTTFNYNVTQHAAGKMTRIRFRANGANSFNINWWYLDNIKLHQVLPPQISVSPTSLTKALVVNTTGTEVLTVSNIGAGAMNFTTQIEYLDKSNEFTVYPVEPGEKVVISGMELSAANAIPGGDATEPARNEVILNYDGPNFDAIGLTSGGTFHVAARFPSSMVGQYAGYVLTAVDVYINNVPSNATLKIWGAGTGTSPGALLHQQVFSSTASSWVTVTLTNGVVLDGTDIWVGYSVTHGASQFPAGCDAGPANPNGDWISLDGVAWEHLAGYGLNYNWNIRAKLNPGAGLWLNVSPNSGNVAPGASLPLTVTFDATGLEIREYNANIKVNSNDPNTPQVIVPVMLDVLVGINEVDREAVMVYPVPAAEVLNISTTQGISQVRMFSYTGQMVYETMLKGESLISIDVKPFHTGAYILQFITADGQTFSRRIIVSR